MTSQIQNIEASDFLDDFCCPFIQCYNKSYIYVVEKASIFVRSIHIRSPHFSSCTLTTSVSAEIYGNFVITWKVFVLLLIIVCGVKIRSAAKLNNVRLIAFMF